MAHILETLVTAAEHKKLQALEPKRATAKFDGSVFEIEFDSAHALKTARDLVAKWRTQRPPAVR